MSIKRKYPDLYREAMREYGRDSLYVAVLEAETTSDLKNAMETLKSIKGESVFRGFQNFLKSKMGSKAMNRTEIAKELVKIARSLVARDSLIDAIVSQRDVANLRKKADEQTAELAIEVYIKLADAFRLSSDQQEALNRLEDSVSGRLAPAGIRNNIFKAAHALGIKLPSASF